MKRLILAALLSLFAFAVPAEAAACCDGGPLLRWRTVLRLAA